MTANVSDILVRALSFRHSKDLNSQPGFAARAGMMNVEVLTPAVAAVCADSIRSTPSKPPQMSKRSLPAASAASPFLHLVLVIVRPCGGHRLGHEQAASAFPRRVEHARGEGGHQPPIPPRSRPLHRHALESVLGFLSRAGLVHALRVSKEWNGAVRSMKGIGFQFDLNQWGSQLNAFLNSPLARHLGELYSDFGDEGELPWAIGPAQMAQLAARATELYFLNCTCVLPPTPATLLLPRKLTHAELTLTADNVAQLHALFHSLNQLPLMESLELVFEATVPASLNFALLHPPSLQTLMLSTAYGTPISLTDEQIDAFRSPSLASLDSVEIKKLDIESWLALLRPPHTLRWKSIANVPRLLCTVDNSTSLVSLSGTLTELAVWPAYEINFLPQLNCLTELGLYAREGHT